MAEDGLAPSDFTTLEVTIRERYLKLSAKLQEIAAFALDHPDILALETVTQISERANVTPSSLVRFAQAFGFDGFSDMQAVFKSRLFAPGANYVERLEQAGTMTDSGAILAAFAAAAKDSIVKLENRLDRKALDAATDCLAQARSITIIAQKRSFPVASYLAYGLLNVGKSAHLLESGSGLAQKSIELLQARDALIAVSFKPYARATLEAVESAANKAAIVTITDSIINPLQPYSRIALCAADPEVNHVRGLSTSMLLAVILVVSVGRRMIES